MLVLRGEALVRGHYGPTVIQIAYLGSPLVDHGLDGERHAFSKAHATASAPEVAYVGLSVEFVADPVAAEFQHDPIIVVLRELLDSCPDVTETLAGRNLGDPGFQALRGDVQEFARPWRDVADRVRVAGVADPAA
jgi:hypothetical protein